MGARQANMPTPRKNTNDTLLPVDGMAGMNVPAGDAPPDAFQSEKIAAFNDCNFARMMGMHITHAQDGYARVVMDCTGKCSPRAVAHGGAIFSLADQAFGIAANCGNIERVAVSVHIQYIARHTVLLSQSLNGFQITAPVTRTVSWYTKGHALLRNLRVLRSRFRRDERGGFFMGILIVGINDGEI